MKHACHIQDGWAVGTTSEDALWMSWNGAAYWQIASPHGVMIPLNPRLTRKWTAVTCYNLTSSYRPLHHYTDYTQVDWKVAIFSDDQSGHWQIPTQNDHPKLSVPRLRDVNAEVAKQLELSIDWVQLEPRKVKVPLIKCLSLRCFGTSFIFHLRRNQELVKCLGTSESMQHGPQVHLLLSKKSIHTQSCPLKILSNPVNSFKSVHGCTAIQKQLLTQSLVILLFARRWQNTSPPQFRQPSPWWEASVATM